MHAAKEKYRVLCSAIALVIVATIIFLSVFSVAAAKNSVKTASGLSDTPIVVEMANGDLITAKIGARGFNTDVIKSKKITVEYNGGKNTVYMAAGTVSDVLEKLDITLGLKQVVSPGLNSEITANMIIKVYNGKKIRVTADGKTESIYVRRGKTAEVLNENGYMISSDDILDVDKNSEIWNTDSVTVKRVTFKETVKTESVEFKKINEASDEIELGKTKLKTKGINGKRLLTKKVKYIDGKKVSEEVVGTKEIVKPVDEITLVGTKGVSKNGGIGTFKDMYGNTVAYKSVHTGSGTAYTAPSGACTATGVPAYFGGVAVNPNIIPYGSKLYIASTDGSVVYGYATAVDTGGALMDGSALVDCFYNTYNECISFGRREVNVYVIA